MTLKNQPRSYTTRALFFHTSSKFPFQATILFCEHKSKEVKKKAAGAAPLLHSKSNVKDYDLGSWGWCCRMRPASLFVLAFSSSVACVRFILSEGGYYMKGRMLRRRRKKKGFFVDVYWDWIGSWCACVQVKLLGISRVFFRRAFEVTEIFVSELNINFCTFLLTDS